MENNIFKLDPNKPKRLIELFAGIGATAKAWINLKKNYDNNIEFEHYKVVEFDQNPIISYNNLYNTNFKATDITAINGKDLEIVDTDKYEYILSYTFPCTEVSLSGNMRGISKGSETSSSLLWEVERLLKETKELPQVLLMENVSLLLSKKYEKDLTEWKNFLSSLGYSNFIQKLNAKDFGVPQTRSRVYMISVLGDYKYEFPKPIPLTTTLKDLLIIDEKQDWKKVPDNYIRYGSYYTWKDNKGNYNTQCNRASDINGYCLTIATSNTLYIFNDGYYRKLFDIERLLLMGSPLTITSR